MSCHGLMVPLIAKAAGVYYLCDVVSSPEELSLALSRHRASFLLGVKNGASRQKFHRTEIRSTSEVGSPLCRVCVCVLGNDCVGPR